jgi:hypothetical protein
MINILICFAFSLLAPGAGQFYNGHYYKAVFFGMVFSMGLSVFLPMFLRSFQKKPETFFLKAIRFFNFVYATLIALSVFDAILFCWKQKNPFEFENVAFSLVFAIAIISLHRNLKSKHVFDMLVGNGMKKFEKK